MILNDEMSLSYKINLEQEIISKQDMKLRCHKDKSLPLKNVKLLFENIKSKEKWETGKKLYAT